jgi:RimJ/RimL family protein N-acetyltransferase
MLTTEDGKQISNAVDETWDDLAQTMQWATNRAEFACQESSTAYAQRCQQRFIAGEDFTFGGFLKNNGELVLLVRLAPFLPAINEYEFCGIWCRKPYQRQGYMLEAIRELIHYSSRIMQAAKWYAVYADCNIPSQQLFTRLGFEKERRLVEVVRLPNGKVFSGHLVAHTTSGYARN